MIEIPPEEFGHGRTRNLGAERSSGDLICFLTQDAVPVDGWLDAFREAFTLDDRAGAAFGPHLPHPDTSPMIARELTEFFDGFAPDGRPVLQRRGDPTFLSNVNACYAASVLGRAALPGRGLLGGSGLRPRDARGGLGEGVPSGGRRAARARLRRTRLHPALLRRVPRACARRPATWSRCSRSRPRASSFETRAGCASSGMSPASQRAGCHGPPRTRPAAAWAPRWVRAPRGSRTAFSGRSRSRGGAPATAAGA